MNQATGVEKHDRAMAESGDRAIANRRKTKVFDSNFLWIVSPGRLSIDSLKVRGQKWPLILRGLRGRDEHLGHGQDAFKRVRQGGGKLGRQ
jgi:hypothetical protein